MALFIVVPKLPAAAMAIYPFILVKKKAYQDNVILVNHEKIHHKQQLELLIVPFYLIYVANYLFNLVKYDSHQKAYQQIVFEKEAYANENDFNYLNNRKPFAWLKMR
ncbi:hypothetical protein [Pedobacter sp.]